MLEKTYRPESVERAIYTRWEESGAFAANPDSAAEPWVVMMPPPNVTGSLHMGHALNTSLQDILTRYYRMNGRDALWQPGMDHAGIATQMVVERRLAEEGIDRRSIGRDRFVERVWQWKAESGGAITTQLRRLGASPDWSRERFTLDDGLSLAVRTVFVKLYRDGLIYRDKRLVNWDCTLKTAISDLEVVQREVQGQLWYIRYPLADDPGRHITVATTRPETMLADTAVAVHPDDDRYRDLIGKTVMLPLVDRPIPIVADSYSDPEKGTGAVKITPGHDFNDFEVGRRHDLEAINILDAEGRINAAAPEQFQGLDRFDARKQVVAALEERGLLEKVEKNPHMVPFGDRSNSIIEPWLTDQWYVDAARLAEPAIAAVEDGRTRFVPKTWENTYFEWMRNIQPWCISRQLWWGHRIPAWYGPDGKIFVAMNAAEAKRLAAEHYGDAGTTLTQDEDVLDTWFSSGLWPFSTLGWPEDSEALKRYYPGAVLITGFDIIFFWVARMMMFGLYAMGDVPFRDVYIHALVRDESGQKMSKSKGNVIDPLALMDKFGTDALRFTLTAMAAQGRDIKLSEQRVAGYRNFVTKLWNAARFCEMNQCRPVDGFDPAACRETVNRWIIGEAEHMTRRVRDAIEAYRFNEAADAVYHFLWGTFCDWYLEFAKPIFADDGDQALQAETRAAAAWTLDRALKVLHPIMPFVTEALYQALHDKNEGLLITASWPRPDEALLAGDAREEMDWVVRLISTVRSVRTEMNVPAGARIPLLARDLAPANRDRLERHRGAILRLARLSDIAPAGRESPAGAVQAILDEATFLLPLADVIDIGQERARLDREIAKAKAEVAKLEKKLANPKFRDKAPADVVAEQEDRRAEAARVCSKLEDALARLTAA